MQAVSLLQHACKHAETLRNAAPAEEGRYSVGP
jgi:hypothetical protein